MIIEKKDLLIKLDEIKNIINVYNEKINQNRKKSNYRRKEN